MNNRQEIIQIVCALIVAKTFSYPDQIVGEAIRIIEEINRQSILPARKYNSFVESDLEDDTVFF